MKKMGIVIVVLLAAAVAVWCWLRPAFGRQPQGARLERIEHSPNYCDGAFRNRELTPLFSSDKGIIESLLGFLFRDKSQLYPADALSVVKTDLHHLPLDEDWVVWFGHSSYLLQLGGKRFLVDPVFYAAAPLAIFNKPFAGTEAYRPSDIPSVDYLLLTHDHWDHLDRRTVLELKDRTDKIICPLGVGEHLEYWGVDPLQIVEMDWDEHFADKDSLTIHCLPARHFSGRGLTRNKTLWASYLVEACGKRVYLGGDGGYGRHFAEAAQRFAPIDLAILENGQYNTDWRFIHLLPEGLSDAAKALGASRLLTIHHAKYALARHRWEEPLERIRAAADRDSLPLLTPRIGEPMRLSAMPEEFESWWKQDTVPQI